MGTQFTLPPDTRAVGTPNPAGDMNGVVDALTASGAALNVLNAAYNGGADPFGNSDSWPAIQAAITAAASAGGGTVYFPPGTYETTAPLAIPSGVTLQGAGGWPSPSQDAGTVLVPSASFAGSAVITMTCASGGPVIGGKIRDLGIDGSALGGTVAGITGTGNVTNAVIENVFIYKVSGAGIDPTISNGTGSPHGWHVNHVRVDSAGGNGINVGGHTDGQWYDVHAIGSGGHGWSVAGSPANSRFTGCRAEWSGAGKDGFHVVSTWNSGTGSGGCVFLGCTTDRNDNHGMNITATGSVPILLSGCVFRRDGRNGGSGGGSFAGLNLNGSTCPVIVSGCSVFPGVDDNGTGTNSPQIGLSATSASNVQVESGYIQGATTAYNDGGGNSGVVVGPMVITATGTTSSPSVQPTPFLAAMNAASLQVKKPTASGGILQVTNSTSGPSGANTQIHSAASGDNALALDVTGDSASRLKLDSAGALYWGGGSTTQDAKLARSAASKLSLTDNGAGNTPQLSLETSVSSAGVPLLAITNHAAADLAAAVSVAGDTNSRLRVDSNGQIKWGPGNATQDCTLSRPAAGLLATDTSTSLDVGARALGMVQPRDQSLVTWTFDPATASGNSTVSSGTVYLSALYVSRSVSVTTLYWYVDTASAVSATSGQNFAGLINSAGTLLQSTGVDSSITSTGLKTTTISSQAVTPGLYWAAFVFNFTGTLKLRATGNTNPSLINVGTTAATNRCAVNGSGTSLASITPSSNTTGGGLSLYWFALV